MDWFVGWHKGLYSLKIDLTFDFQHQKCYYNFQETGPWSCHINYATKII